MMIDLSKYTDPYERRARLYPALICFFPVLMGIALSYPKLFSTLSGLVTLAVSVGLLQLISHLARDRGKALEAALFDSWGGVPSVKVFRYRDSTIPGPAKLKYHEIMSNISKIKSPTKEEEEKDPHSADDIYASWSDYLRGKTRDTKKYGLLFKENMNYGFRRNLLGIKWFCITSSIIGGILLLSPVFAGSGISPTIVVTVLFCVIYILVFMFIVTPTWVKVVADAYAKQLIESINA